MSGFEADNDRTIFRCPECDACRWFGDLMLPGGLFVRCMECGWSRFVSEIEADMKAGLL